MSSPNSPPQHAVPEAGFPKSILKKKQGEASANFSPMQSCKIPSTPARGEGLLAGTRETAYLCPAQTCFPAKPAGMAGGKVWIPIVLRKIPQSLTSARWGCQILSYSVMGRNKKMEMQDVSAEEWEYCPCSVSDNVINPLVFKKVLPEKAEARKVKTVQQSQKPQARLKNVH